MTPISVTYSDEKLRILVEEYITQQKKEFTFKSVCSFILYRAMEEERTANTGLYESDHLAFDDSKRISVVLEKIIQEGRVVAKKELTTGCDRPFADSFSFEKRAI